MITSTLQPQVGQSILSLNKRKPHNEYKFSHLSGGSLIEHLSLLGLFRVIHQQLDSRATGHWVENTFVLRTDKTQEEIIHFFLNDYNPLPFFMVWTNDFESSRMGLGGFIDELLESRGLTEQANVLSDLRTFKESYLSGGEIDDLDTKTRKNFIFNLFNRMNDEAFKDVLCSLAIPFTDYKGNDTCSYSPLGNDNGGWMYGKRPMDRSYWLAYQAIEQKHLESTLFGINHDDVLVPGVELRQLDPFTNWVDQSGIGIGVGSATPSKDFTWMGKKVQWGGDPVQTLLAIEGMTFFRGRVGSEFSHSRQLKGVDFDESVVATKEVKTMPFVVVNRSVSPTTSTWAEYSGGTKELWAPQWKTPMTYLSLLMEIRDMSEVAQKQRTTFHDSTDMMLFLSKAGQKSGVTVFHRYSFVKRIGQGGSESVATSLEKFDCQTDKRVDVITSFLPALRFLRQSIAVYGTDFPNSATSKFESIECDFNDFVAGRQPLTKLVLNFSNLISYLRRSGLECTKDFKKTLGGVKPKDSFTLDRWFYPTLRLISSGNEFSYEGRHQLDTPANRKRFGETTFSPTVEGRFFFNPKLVTTILEEYNTTEVRLALSMASGRPCSTLHDISEYLDGTIDAEMMQSFRLFFEMCRMPSDVPFGVTKGETPWMPMDFVLAKLLRNDTSSEVKRDSSDTALWKNLVSFNNPEEAMQVAIDRLSIRGTLRHSMSVSTSTPSDILFESADIPLSSTDIKRLINFIN